MLLMMLNLSVMMLLIDLVWEVQMCFLDVVYVSSQASVCITLLTNCGVG